MRRPSPRAFARVRALVRAAALLLALEAFARILLSLPGALSSGDSVSRRYKWVKAHRAPSAGLSRYGYDVYHARRGWALKPNLRGPREPGALQDSNSRGLRGRIEYPYVRAGAGRRILVLGDSFTFGEGVGDDETYPSRLQRLLPRDEVINLGVHGYGHDQMLLYLQDEGVKYRPDVVLLGFVDGDADRSMLSFRDFAKPWFELGRDGRPALAGVPVPSPSAVMRSFRRRCALLDLARIASWRAAAASGLYGRRRARLEAALLDELVATVRRGGGTPVFVDLDGVPQDRPGRGAAAFLGRYCAERGVALIAIPPAAVKAITSRPWLGSTGHFTARTNALVAEAIAAGLRRAARAGVTEPATSRTR